MLYPLDYCATSSHAPFCHTHILNILSSSPGNKKLLVGCSWTGYSSDLVLGSYNGTGRVAMTMAFMGWNAELFVVPGVFGGSDTLGAATCHWPRTLQSPCADNPRSGGPPTRWLEMDNPTPSPFPGYSQTMQVKSLYCFHKPCLPCFSPLLLYHEGATCTLKWFNDC